MCPVSIHSSNILWSVLMCFFNRGFWVNPADLALPRPQAVHVDWSGLKLPWLDLDWFMDVSSQITDLDLSHNCLSSLPSVVPWGLIHLRSLNLSHNQLRELPTPTSSQEIICSQSVTQLHLYNFICRSLFTRSIASELLYRKCMFLHYNQENAFRGDCQGNDCIVIMLIMQSLTLCIYYTY